MANENEEFDRVWSVADYGNIAAIDAKTPAKGQARLFGTSLPQGTSTITKAGRIAPSQQNQKVAQEVLKDPRAFVAKTADPAVQDESLVDKGKTILANLFNTEDKKDLQIGPANLSGVETVWDGMLTAFNWGYDRINQGLSWAASAAPGGLDTFSWDQAGEISAGQAAVTANAQLINQMRDKFGLPGVTIGQIGASLTNPVGLPGALAGQAFNAEFTKRGFNILDPAQRKKAFEEEAVGKWATGLTDATITIFADPLIVGGKFLKVARLKYIDSPISNPTNQMRRWAELEDGVELARKGDRESMAPIARYFYDAVTPDENGVRKTARELQMRGEVEDATNAEGLAAALEMLPNGDYETARLLGGVALGLEDAMQELARRSVIAADTLSTAERNKLVLEMVRNPEAMTKTMADLDKAIDVSEQTYSAMKTEYAAGRVTETEVADAYRNVINNLATKKALDNGELPDPLVTTATIDEQIEVADAMVAELAARKEWFRLALDEENMGALRGANRGFAPDTPIGQFVSKRREARAERRYQRKSTAGQGWRSEDYFGASRVRRTVRFFSRAWDETPAYYVGIAGESSVDQGREIGAFLDSLEYLGSGNTFNVLDKQGNVVRTVDGITRKNEYYSRYARARAERQDVSFELMQIQEEIARDMASVYNIPIETVQEVFDRMFYEQKKVADSVLRSENGAFFDSSNKFLSVAPFLKSQLSQGMYLLPYDKFEKIAQKLAAGKIKDPSAKVVMTKGQIVGSKIASADAIFQDLWRPAVLFRLGYTQRNVAEGLFRSVMFNSSLSPLLWAGKAGYLGSKNVRRAQRAARRAEEARSMIKRADTKRDEFDNLVRTQKGIQERTNALQGAKIKMATQEGERATAGVVPLPTFTDDGAGLISADGAFRIQKVVKDIAAPEAKPARFKTVNKATGAMQYGDFALTRVDGKRWRVQGNGIDTVLPSRNAARVFAKKQEADLAATRGPAAPTRVESWVIGQLDPNDGSYIIGKRQFKTAAEAEELINREVQRAFGPNGRSIAGNPQLNAIVERGRAARRKIVEPFTDVDGKRYVSTAEIDKEMASLAAEGKRVAESIDNIGRRPVPAFMKNTRFQNWRENQLDEIESQIDSIAEFKKTFYETNAKLLGVSEKDVFQALTPTEQKNILIMDNNLDDLRSRATAMERDDYFALAEYESQGAAKLRANNSTKIDNLPYGVVLEDAFGNPRNADLRFRNMSANNTMRASLAARMQLSESILYKMKMRDYVEVEPKDGERYWQGMSDMLRQFAVDRMGQMFIRGDSDEKIATWLLSRDGESTRNALDEAWSFQNNFNPDIPPRIGNSMENALAYAENVRAGLVQITAGKTEIWDMLRSGPVSPDQLKQVLQGNPALKPVIGYTNEFAGVKNVMDIYRSLTQKAFEWIGTMPEDAFVRAPFYAQRYQETRAAGLLSLEKQFGNMDRVPLEAIYRVEQQAARRALKDTKDFLYTIDRRTNLGKYGESIFPFISATQNSITSIARLTRRDPALPGMMLALWQAPTRMGWEDENGNVIIPLPTELLPKGVQDFFGLEGINRITVPKGSLNVIFPESGYAFAPRPSAPMQVAASELMKKGFLGFSVEAPPMLVSFLGQKDADALWQQFKNYTFGEESGLSPEFASYDKLLPPIANRMIQYMQKDGSSQYGYQYALQAKTQALKWWAGERDDYPTPEEIQQRTNGMFMLRMLGNAFAFTPPAYESVVQPLVDTQRLYDQLYGIEGPMKFNEQFGDVLLTIGNTATTSNVGGAMSSADAVRNIKDNESLIRSIAPEIADENLDIFGILINGDPKDSVYDTNAYRWLSTTNIPGTSRKWREMNTGAEAEAEVQRQAGWVEYMKFKGQLDAMRQQRGLKSFRVRGADQLNSYRKEFIDNMKANPLYAAWVTDFESMGSSKTYDAVRVLKAALSDQNFMNKHAEDPVWTAAALYVDTREKLIDMVKESGASLGSKTNQQLALDWEEFRNNLIDNNPGWAAIANRYLNGDDVPKELGTSFMDVIE